MIETLKRAIARIETFRRLRTKRLLRWSTTEPSARVLSRQGRFAGAAVETKFTRADGSDLPVLRDFRYAISPPLSFLPAMRFLAALEARNLLGQTQREAYRKLRGARTLMDDYAKAQALAHAAAHAQPSYVVPESATAPEFLPGSAEIEAVAARETELLANRLQRVREFAAPIKAGGRVLEIGFTTGGYSLVAWDRLGFRPVGIDNAYDGTAEPPTLHRHVAERARARPEFVFADVSRRTPLETASFDVVYSVSVLEHLSDLDGTFAELRRLLKPGGLMIHAWNPFFSPNGGHPWGNLDAPWGHLRLSLADTARYLESVRPFENTLASPWVFGTLDRETTLARMQERLMRAGFRILAWDETPAPAEILGDLDPATYAECRKYYPEVTLADLTTADAMFVARMH